MQEDSGLYRINLSDFAYDVDDTLEDLTWTLMPGYDGSLVIILVNNTDNNTVYLEVTPIADQDGSTELRIRLEDDESSYAYQNITINITPVNDAPSAPSIIQPAINSTTGGTFSIIWNASTDVDSPQVNYSLEYTNDSGMSWYVINSTIVGASTTTYSWASASDITGVQNITLRLNATDGINTTSITHGNFTVDNDFPVITINAPLNIVVGTSTLINVTTSETADCSFLVNGSAANIDNPTTDDQTEHIANRSSLTIGNTYNFTVTCTDNSLNSDTASKAFSVRSVGLEFVSAATNRSVYIEGESSNITFVILSRSYVHTIDWSITNGTALWNYDAADLYPSIDESNSVAYAAHPVVAPSTAETGPYNLTITRIISNLDSDIADPDIDLGTIYTVYPLFTQTINVD